VIAAAAPKANVPKTLAAVQSAAPRDTGGTFSGPTPLDSILK
jgi:hypothetical protein